MRVRVHRWEDSMVVPIPRVMADSMQLESGVLVDVSVLDGKLVIAPAGTADDLERLLADVTDDNRHREIETGMATGNEAW